MNLKQYSRKFKQNQKGFTLVELIVVIAIIGILAGIMLPRYYSFTDDARKGAAISEAKSIRTMAETFYSKYGEWPVVDQDTGFQVQTGFDDDDDPDYDNSPTFIGKISGLASGNRISNGSFSYKKAGETATCDEDGAVTAD